jgi:hypothetical protein
MSRYTCSRCLKRTYARKHSRARAHTHLLEVLALEEDAWADVAGDASADEQLACSLALGGARAE